MFPGSLEKLKRSLLVSGNSIAAKYGKGQGLEGGWRAGFEDGRQLGEWTTYDDKGKVVKVTRMKSSS
jgi:hypothetical protein